MPARVLVVDDDLSICELLANELVSRDYEVSWDTSPLNAVDRLANADFDLVLTDLRMPEMNGPELCERVRALRDDVPVIVMTAFGSMESAVKAIRAGAYDFVTKPCDVDQLVLAFERALRDRALRHELKRLHRVLRHTSPFGAMIGTSEPMQGVYDLIARVAETDTTVLVTGESGTGKELVAQAIHARSLRREGPFVAINCAAMPESLLESELFGHVKGAFTDARGPRPGLFVRATGGTLFLDEMGEMSTPMQVKLLRALQERVVRPVGSDDEIAVDARIIAATNTDLEAAVAAKRFREDLFYRINVLQIQVPPLRTRGSDVLLLAQHFIDVHATRSRRDVSGLMTGAAENMLTYPWPGNVRELQNCIERAVALARFDRIGVDDLPERMRDAANRPVVEKSALDALSSLAEVEQRHILRVLDAAGGSKTLAAQVLGIDRRTLYRKLE